MNAKTLLELIKTKHSSDTVVPECKDGSTHMRGTHRRLDAWVLKSSWSKPVVWGYEIKVSRQDFLKDDKWQDYLRMCNQLYFVCPYGLIHPEELSEGVGLYWASKNGTKLYNKRKAAHRDISIPEDVFRYVIMYRAQIASEQRHAAGSKEFWLNWLKDKKIDREFGRHVGSRIKRTVEEKIEAVETQNTKLENEIKKYENMKSLMLKLGFEPTERFWEWRAEQKLKALHNIVPGSMMKNIESLIEMLGELKQNIEIENLSS